MKKNVLLLAIAAFMSVLNVTAQNKAIDLTSGEGRGVTLSGTDTLTSQNGGDYFLSGIEDYGMYSGVILNLSNFNKLDESASNSLCSLNIYYTDGNGNDQKASMGFWSKGKKTVRFDNFRNGNEDISIEPGSIKRISIGMGGNKQVDVQIELGSRDPQP